MRVLEVLSISLCIDLMRDVENRMGIGEPPWLVGKREVSSAKLDASLDFCWEGLV